MIVLRNLLITYLAMLLLASPLTEASSLINVPLNPDLSDFNRETYRFVHRLLNKRVLPGIRRGSLPLTRKQVVSYLLEVHRKQENGEIKLSAIDQARLNALLAFYREVREFPKIATANGGTATIQSQSNGRLHVMTMAGEDYRFSFDLRASQRTITHLVDNISTEQPVEGNMFVTTIYPHLYGQVGETFAFTTDIAHRFVYGEIFEDFFPDETKIRQLEGNLKNRTAINGYMKFDLPWLELQLGQETLQWGPGYHDSLLISKNPLAMDMIKLQATYDPVTFTAFTGVLEDMAEDINDKYISGHRVEGYFWNRFGFGISEVVVYGSRFEPGYLNPVNIYLINEQPISRADGRVPGSGDNVLMSVDMRLRPIDNFEIYGELMVDDGNPAANFKHWDTKFGILGGIYLTDPFGIRDTDFHAEYAFINQYAYTHVNPVNVYKHFTTPIGHQIGSDADNLWLELRRRWTDKLETVFGYELERHGTGNIDKEHPPDAPKDDVWTPLSGITQSEHRLSVGANWVVIGRYSIYAEWTRVWRRNLGNRLDVHENANEIEAKFLSRIPW
ncbi:capsule assembly Wzi family protein [Candidatus Poribacteria bacterium]|nr:capsule assembly Wzi family protein [Candidatus Poribacteria bacterium]MYB00792.1 capsule assembly Wzi family protein [Candidatus Poribacteria bacterium]